MQRLLVIRGGAIGDMILTLPALRGLRRAFPQARINLLGYPSRAVLAEDSRYVDQVIDLERWPLHHLFSRQPSLPTSLVNFLATYDGIVSYLPTQDTTFHTNLHHYYPGNIVTWQPLPPARIHATDHLLQAVRHFLPLPPDPIPYIAITSVAQEAAERFWKFAGLPHEGVLACHIGSGGAHKLWPLAGWQQVFQWARQRHIPVLLISGPAEQERGQQRWYEQICPAWPCASNLPLPHLAALLTRCQMFMGHDSGTSHLAAAVGTTTLALFGPTEPLMWGPRSRRASILTPPIPQPLTLANLHPTRVIETLEAMYNDTFCFTPSSIDSTIVSPVDRVESGSL